MSDAVGKPVRVIKRYQNRKLYDTEQSSYVTLEEIFRMMKEGKEVMVIDNRTGQDITYMTQIQLLFELERKWVTAEDHSLLMRVVTSGRGDFIDYIRLLENKVASLEGSKSEETSLSSHHLYNETQVEQPRTLN